jgi:hypothetical protein
MALRKTVWRGQSGGNAQSLVAGQPFDAPSPMIGAENRAMAP